MRRFGGSTTTWPRPRIKSEQLELSGVWGTSLAGRGAPPPNTGSEKQETIDDSLDDYLRTPTSKIDELVEKSEQGKYLDVEDGLTTLTSGVIELAGFKRLNRHCILKK